MEYGRGRVRSVILIYGDTRRGDLGGVASGG